MMTRLTVDESRQLVVRLMAVLCSGLRHGRFCSLERLRSDVAVELAQQGIHVDRGVPHLQVGHLGELGHRRAVALDRSEHDLGSILAAETVVAGGDLDACGQALDVPLERTGSGLVEVVDVEHHPSLRRPERAEVHQVGITAQLHIQTGARRTRKVGRHEQRGASVERERRHEHAPVADRHEFGDPRRRLALEERNGVGAHRAVCECRVRRSWHLAPRGLPTSDTLGHGQVRHHRTGSP